MIDNFLDNIYVIHVREGYEERRIHIDKHLPERGITNFKYILDGDIKDLTPSILNKHFANHDKQPSNSCFYKHQLVYEEMVNNNIPYAIVFEDDVVLRKDTVQQLRNIIKELHLNNEQKYLVNIEKASSSVPFLIRKKGQHTYLAKQTKLTGGYIIDLQLAKEFNQYFHKHKTAVGIDVWQNELKEELQFNIFWVEPSLVEQGSKTGKFSSTLSGRNKSLYTSFRSVLKEFYKCRILSNIRSSSYEIFNNVKKY